MRLYADGNIATLRLHPSAARYQVYEVRAGRVIVMAPAKIRGD
jgi:hypothetical protein